VIGAENLLAESLKSFTGRRAAVFYKLGFDKRVAGC